MGKTLGDILACSGQLLLWEVNLLRASSSAALRRRAKEFEVQVLGLRLECHVCLS